MNKYIYSFLILFVISIGIFAQSANLPKKPKYLRVSEAYGFLIGQEQTLNIIKKKFPEFEFNVLKVQMDFNSTFGNSKAGMELYLTDYLGQNEFKEYEVKLIIELKKMQHNQVFTKDLSTNFIEEVQNRANGGLPSPILETLLSFQYLDRPEDELLFGFTKTFKTKGHPKCKNTDWQIKIPKSWKSEEADRPNIIQKFISDYGSGYHSIMLMVKDNPLPKEYKASKEELNEFFNEKEMKSIIPVEAKFISFTKMTIDNNIGGMVQYEQKVDRLDYIIKIRTLQFMFLKGNKSYFLQCSVASEKTDADLSLVMKKYLPLFKLVANTIVVNEQYK